MERPNAACRSRALALDALHFDAIVVPRGAEAQAVQRGWPVPRPLIVGVPAGVSAGRALVDGPTLETVLVLGVCGAIDPALRVGGTVVYECITDAVTTIALDAQLTAACAAACGSVPQRAAAVGAVVSTVRAKAELRAATGAAVVDMECAAIALALQRRAIRVAMVRIVSDDAAHALPDLSNIYDTAGTLRPLPLAAALFRNPLRGARFIRNAMFALQALRATATCLSAFDLDR